MKQTMFLALAGCLALGLLGCEPGVSDAHPRVHIEYRTGVNGGNGLDYVFAEGTMSGIVRDGGSYTNTCFATGFRTWPSSTPRW